MRFLKPFLDGLSPYFFKGLLPAGIVFAMSLLGLESMGISPGQALRDPAQQSGASSLMGFVSHLGIWTWIAAAAIAFYLLGNTAHRKYREQYALMGILSIALAADDLFMIHERFLGQKICFSFYIGCALLLAARHGRSLWENQSTGIIFTGFFLSASMGIDLIQHLFPTDWQHLRLIAEDGFKFLGSCSWLFVLFNSPLYQPSQSS